MFRQFYVKLNPPALGADVVWVNNTGSPLRLIYGETSCVMSAVAANRYVRLALINNAVGWNPVVGDFLVPAVANASVGYIARTHSQWTTAIVAMGGANNFLETPISEMVVDPGMSVLFTAINKDPGDQFGFSVFVFEQVQTGD